MPTDVVKKIGSTNSPTTMDYSSIAAWVAACPANLVTADQRWIGECYDQGKFTTGGTIGSGVTTDATRYIILRCAAGASFNAKAGVRTTALAYNSATGSGVAVELSAAGSITVSAQYTVFDGLQVKTTGYAICINAATANVTIRNCVVTRTTNLIGDNATTVLWDNCLFVQTAASGTTFTGIGQFHNCTFINTGGAGTSVAVHPNYNAAQAKNCAFFGYSAAVDTGVTLNSSSDYNATDLSTIATAGGGGAHNVTSLTFASQFVNAANDFRAVSGSGLHAGTPDATNAPLDISLFTRDATTPYIGAWEASAPATGISASPATIPAGHAGNMTLTLTGTGTSWTAGTPGTPTITVTNSTTGTTTVTKVSQSVASGTSASLVVTTGAGAGTFTISDGTNSTAVTVATPAVSVSPTSGTVSGTQSITLTGTNTLWATDHPAFTYTGGPVGTSIGSIAWTNDTTATATMTTGSATGSGTLTDPSTGKTCTFAVNTVSGTITPTSPVQWNGFWRNPSGGHGSIPITGTYTGGPGTLTVEASFNGGAYATIGTASGGTFTGTLTGQNAGFGTLTVRFVSAPTISATVTNVAIGAVIGIAGQSNALGVLDNLQTYSNGSGLKAVGYLAGNASYTSVGVWGEANDPLVVGWTLGSPWPLLATHLMHDLGYPVIFVETAIGGRSLVWYWTKFRPDTGAAGSGAVSPLTGYDEIVSSIASSGVAGMDALIWYQGEQDVDNGIARPVYAAALMTFAAQIAADVANAPKLAVVQFGHDGTPVSAGDAIKLAISDAVRSGGNFLDGMAVISDFSDGLHLATDAEGQKCADRVFALLKSEVYGGTAGAGRGPRVVGCQYNTARTAITVTFDKVLKTGLAMDGSLWAVTGNGVAATVSSVAYGADTSSAVLTLASAAALPVLVSFAQGGSTAGKVWPLGPDFALPAPAGTINLPAEPFLGVRAAPASPAAHKVRFRLGAP